MHSGRLSSHLLGRLLQLSPCQHRYGEVVEWIKGKFVVATKGDLTVLHNCNKMVNAFSTTEWVLDSGGTIISRSVTFCAGMTVHLVLLANQSWLSWRWMRKKLPKTSSTRTGGTKGRSLCTSYCYSCPTQQICFIMGPLDMCGLVRAATIISCLKYGAFFGGQSEQDDPVFLIRLKDEELVEASDD